MRWAVFFLSLLGAAGCVVEDRPVVPDLDGAVEAGECGFCPTDEPVCVEGTCVECTAEQRDLCDDRDQQCDDDTMRCVDCLGNDDCTLPAASRCDLELNECAPCITGPDCDGVDGLDETGNACDEGSVCVECTPEAESTTCQGGVSCNPSTKTCTNTVVGSLEVCEPCVSDSECGERGTASDAFRCVEMVWEGNRYPDAETGYCLKTTDGGCEPPYTVDRPFEGRPSLSGPPLDDYCGIDEAVTTCDAVRALLEGARCTDGGDELCPTGGLCRLVGSVPDVCTYECGLPLNCPPDAPADTCDSGPDSVDYCGG